MSRTIEDLRAEIESEYSWRLDELRFFENVLADLKTGTQRDQYRRALVLLLYAHFEGFCSFALRLFVRAANDAQITCSEATPAIAAAALADVLAALRDPNKKCPLFKHVFPDDTKLHKFARDIEFVERSSEIGARPVRIPDWVVDTESNLQPAVLRKNLFRLGLPHDLFASLEGQIHRLLQMRNGISHGMQKSGVDERTYGELRGAVRQVFEAVKTEVMAALTRHAYLSQSTP
jgi:hypothetical protein